MFLRSFLTFAKVQSRVSYKNGSDKETLYYLKRLRRMLNPGCQFRVMVLLLVDFAIALDIH